MCTGNKAHAGGRQAALHTPSDLVLLVSSHRPGNILQRSLGELSPEMLEWSQVAEVAGGPVHGWVTAPHAVCCLMRKVCFLSVFN